MVQSINTKVDIAVKGTSFHGLTTYGQIMVGDRAFEFYNDRNVKDFIQIPWEEVDYVTASVMMKGKNIPRYAIVTKNSGSYSFASKEPKKVLRAVNQYVPSDRMLRSLSAIEVVKKKVTSIFKK